MKPIHILACFAILALTANLVLADVCDDGECTSTVAVFQLFNTTDCSGPSTLEISSNYTIPCEDASYPNFNQSNLIKCSSAGFDYITTADSRSCKSSTSSFVYTSPVGVCFLAGDSKSNILWCNKASIKNTFKAVKLATNETLITRDELIPCDNTTGCTNNTGTARYYNAAGCNAANLTLVYPASVIATASLQLGTCYTKDAAHEYDRRNVMATCSKGKYQLTFSVGGCGPSANTLSVRTYPTDTCIHIDPDNWMSISCPSAASTLVASAPLVFILFVLFLVI